MRGARCGQAMVETALVLPLVFFIIFGTVEGGLVIFSMETAHFGAQEAAQSLADAGQQTGANDEALKILRHNVGGGTSLVEVQEVDIEKVNEGTPAPACPDRAVAMERFRFDSGTKIPNGPGCPDYPEGKARNTDLCCSDTIRVVVVFSYRWRSGLLGAANAGLSFNVSATARLQPQTPLAWLSQ
ncbi:MAG: TadE family protein [Candidatus Dormibacteria bacterium]